MALLRQLTRGLRALTGGRSVDRDVDDELQHFIDESAQELEAGGLTPSDAEREARRRAGSILAMREEVRSSGWEHAIDTFAGDVRYGVRRLVRDRGLALVTVSTLALGIGSATAILSVAAPVFIRLLPFPEADRIHAIWDQGQDRSRLEVTFGTFLELRERSRSFEALAVTRVWQPTLTGGSLPERLEGRAVSADYFRVIGVAPRIGRGLVPADDVPNAARVVLLSDRLWRRRFEADPAIVGTQVTLDGAAYDVIGVMPPAYEHRLMPPIDVWRPLNYDATLPSHVGREWGHHLRMMGRLRAGVSRTEAFDELNQIARDPIARFDRPRWSSLSQGLMVDPLHDELTRAARPTMIAVTAAATLLLLIACVNVINLLLARNAQRRAELSMRVALGAGRGRLVRQLLTETLVLTGFGGIGGLLLAAAATRAVAAMGPAGLPTVALAEAGVVIDTPVFAIAFGVTVIVGLIVGLAPAFSNRDLKAALPQGAWQSSSSHHRMRRALVVAEVAFALVLLTGATLLFRSLQQLFAIEPGFDAHNVLTLQVQVSGPQFRDPAAIHRFFTEATERVRAVPGVTGAALTSLLPLSGGSDIYGLQFEFSDSAGATDGAAFRYGVSPGYFETMGLQLRRGRLLGDQDRAGAPLAVVINEDFARRRFPDTDPLGQRLHIGPVDRPWFTVVGVVSDVKQMSLEEDSANAVYVSPTQWHFPDRAFWLVIKTRGDAAAFAPAVRSAVWAVDKDQPIVRVATLDSMVAATARERSFALLLFEAFGLAALLLTAVGIYGVVSSGVTDRRREIGIRTALGAPRTTILTSVIGEGVRLSVIGVGIGLVAAAAATRGLTSLLFGISPIDPPSYVAVVLLLLGVTIAASWLPARRAVGFDPATTLRAE